MDFYKVFCVVCCMSEKCLPDISKEVSSPGKPDKLAEAIKTSEVLIASTPVLSSVSNVSSRILPSPATGATGAFESYAATIFRSKSVKLADPAAAPRPSSADLQEPKEITGSVL